MKLLLIASLTSFMVAVLLINPAKIKAQNPGSANTELANSYTIESAFTQKTYALRISLPKAYSDKDSIHYPVLYVLDGKFSFQSMSSIRQVLDLGKEIKDIIIVGIDINSSSEDEWFASRYNDFTPSSVLQSDTLWSKLLKIPEGKLKSGGAENFLNTMEKEVIPYIESKYKISGDRGLSGHSLGGLFAGYCLIKKPTLFKRYGINSPSFWWNNNELTREEVVYASNNKELNARVFLSVGGSEDHIMITAFKKFTESLKSHQYKYISVTEKVFDDETHVSVVAACSSRTLKVLYGSNVK